MTMELPYGIQKLECKIEQNYQFFMTESNGFNIIFFKCNADSSSGPPD